MKPKMIALFDLLLVVTLALGMVTAPVAAQPANQQPEAKTSEYLLLLSIPSIDKLQVPGGMTDEQAAQYANKLMYQQAEPILDVLHRLQREGMVNYFELQPEKNAIAVWSETAGIELEPELAGLQPSSESAACGQRQSQTLNQKVFHLSQSVNRQINLTSSIQATNPSINVYAPTGEEWTYIEGQTASNISVSMRILRSGAQIATDTTTSDDGGWYWFDPGWNGDCSSSANAWSVLPGDVVEVTANGNTVTTVVSHLEAYGDTSTHVIGGLVDAYRQVEVDLYWSGTDLCYMDWYSATVSADASGLFSVDFSSQAAFNGRSFFDVYARDTNGNSTFGYYQSYSIVTYARDPYYFYGHIKPNIAFTALLLRSGNPIYSNSGISDPDGHFNVDLLVAIQTGDVIQVSFDGTTLSYTVPPLQAVLDSATNRVSGVTAPSRPIQTWFETREWGSVRTTCYYDDYCATSLSDAGGNFSVNSGIDILPGDTVSMYVYDNLGNYHYGMVNATAIVANLAWDEIQGYWQTPGEDIILRLLDSSHTLLDTFTTTTDMSDGEYYGWFYERIMPGQILEVGNGAITQTMTVQNLTALLNKDTDFLTGSGSQSGRVVIEYSNDEPSIDSYDWSCFETNTTAGAYSLDLTSWDVESQDDGEIFNTGPDGGYTYQRAHALGETIYFNQVYDSYVGGYAMVPETVVTGKLWDGAVLLETVTDTVYYDGRYNLYFTHSFDVGLRSEVSASGQTVNLTIPTLTVLADTTNNALYGQSPANENISLSLTNYFHCATRWSNWCGAYFYVDTTADATGNYTASFAGLYDWDYYTETCHYADVGLPCSDTSANYFQLDENGIYYHVPLPVEPPDAYESDNSFVEATPYAGASVHTFDTTTDEDWIALTITAADIGRMYTLRTAHLGRNADTVLHLYDTDGVTNLDIDDDGGVGYSSLINWTFSTPGTYYVMVKPFSDYRAVICGTGYTFIATSYNTVLPITAR